MFYQFLTWWAQQLYALVPSRLTRREQHWRDALIAEVHPDTPVAPLDLVLRRGRRSVPLGRFALDDSGVRAMRLAFTGHKRPSTVVLRLPSGMLLEQQVVLPLAAERDIENVLGYDMDRITPFAAADLFWTWAIERRNRALGQLHVYLSLIPRAAVSGPISALKQAGVPPSLLEAASPGGALRLLPLRHAVSVGGRWYRHAVALSGGACVALALAAVVVPFVNQTLAAQHAEGLLASLRPQVEEVEALRKRIASVQAGGGVLAAQRERVGDVLGMLATLTEILPDDTYLTDLALRARTASMSGQSAAAARLIAALASDPGIRNPAFTAPVTRSEISGGEGFSIRVEFGL